MANKSQLLKALYFGTYFLSDYDFSFKSPEWVARSMGIDPLKANRRFNYLFQAGYLDRDFFPIKRQNNPVQLVIQPWDQLWRIGVYKNNPNNDLTKRKLGFLLEEVGFRRWQGNWISLLPLEASVAGFPKKVKDSFCLFIGKSSQIDSRAFVARVWSVNNWEKRAKRVIKQTKNEPQTLMKEFWPLIFNYPLVPRELLPVNWPLEKLVKTFRRLFK